MTIGMEKAILIQMIGMALFFTTSLCQMRFELIL